MRQTRRKFDPSFKAKVALEALKERETLQGENSDNLKAMTLMDLHILDEPTAGLLL